MFISRVLAQTLGPAQLNIGAGQSSSVQGLKKIDSGTLMLTNKRLVLPDRWKAGLFP